MIEKITLENFKGIGKATSIRLAPLTLLFGANSAGKSTILHALAYAREIFERHNCDADKTMLGGDALDLGGFKEMVHGHDIQQTIRMRFDYSVGNVPKLESMVGYLPEKGYVRIVVGIPKEIGVLRGYDFPCVLACQIGFDGEPLLELKYCLPDTNYLGFMGCIRRLNIDHPLIAKDREDFERFFPHYEQITFSNCTEDDNEEETICKEAELEIPERSLILNNDALPISGGAMYLPRGPAPSAECSRHDYHPTQQLATLAYALCDRLSVLLNNMAYVGPIREIPSRTFRRSVANPLAKILNEMYPAGQAVPVRMMSCQIWMKKNGNRSTMISQKKTMNTWIQNMNSFIFLAGIICFTLLASMQSDGIKINRM